MFQVAVAAVQHWSLVLLVRGKMARPVGGLLVLQLARHAPGGLVFLVLEIMAVLLLCRVVMVTRVEGAVLVALVAMVFLVLPVALEALVFPTVLLARQ